MVSANRPVAARSRCTEPGPPPGRARGQARHFGPFSALWGFAGGSPHMPLCCSPVASWPHWHRGPLAMAGAGVMAALYEPPALNPRLVSRPYASRGCTRPGQGGRYAGSTAMPSAAARSCSLAAAEPECKLCTIGAEPSGAIAGTRDRVREAVMVRGRGPRESKISCVAGTLATRFKAECMGDPVNPKRVF